MPAVGELGTIDSLFHTAALRIGYLSDVARYEEAWALCDSLQSIHPTQPAPHLYKAAIYVNWMQSYRLNDYQAEVEDNVQRAIDAGVQMLKMSKDAWVSSHVGSAYSYRAIARLRRHNWIGAFLDGRRSIDYLQAALDEDPRLYDVYFPLGGYHYWRTARSSFIRTVAFWMPDRRKLGIRQIDLAIRHGRYIRHGALHGIALSLLDTGDYEAALAYNDQIMAAIEPPTNGSLYTRGRLKAKLRDWPDVEAIFTQLLSQLPDRAIGYQVECKYWIARAAQQQGKVDAALQLSQEALVQSQSRNPALELESVLENFDSIHERLVKLEELLRRAR